jgi:glutathione S-transferase
MGSHMSIVDVVFAPFMLRLSRVLKPYRGWPDPEAGSRWSIWVDAIEGNAQVRATTSTDELYIDSYESVAGKIPISFLIILSRR